MALSKENIFEFYENLNYNTMIKLNNESINTKKRYIYDT